VWKNWAAAGCHNGLEEHKNKALKAMKCGREVEAGRPEKGVASLLIFEEKILKMKE
jgi:hypothetical protein